jgi:hypothetical protein
MATKAVSNSVTTSRDDAEWLTDQVRSFGSAAAAAKALDLERTMVWRITKGRKVSRANLLEIKKRREMAPGAVSVPSAKLAQEFSVADLRFALQYLLQALDAIERYESAKTPRLEK